MTVTALHGCLYEITSALQARYSRVTVADIMSVVKLDTRYPSHPKIEAASDALVVLHLMSILYCFRANTDGFVPMKRLRMMAARSRAVADDLIGEGLRLGLFDPAEGGLMVHDYLSYQPSATQRSRRAAWARERSRVTPGLAKMVKDRDGQRCVRCGEGSDLTIDHIVPVSSGGTSDYENLQTLCLRCNSAKGFLCPG